jgi:hypothetical protein
LLTFVDRVQLELLEVLEVLARRGNQVLQEILEYLERQLLQVTPDLLGPLDLLALKVRMGTRVPRVIVVKQECQGCLAQLGFQAEKVYKEKKGNRYCTNLEVRLILSYFTLHFIFHIL